MPMPSQFLASLSGGSTWLESYASVSAAESGSLPQSPWRQLVEYLGKNPGLEITQLRLQTNGVTITSVAHADGYFHARRIEGSSLGVQKHFHGIGAVFGDRAFITWVDLDTGDLWQEVRRAEGNPCIWHRNGEVVSGNRNG